MSNGFYDEFKNSPFNKDIERFLDTLENEHRKPIMSDFILPLDVFRWAYERGYPLETGDERFTAALHYKSQKLI